MPLAPFRAYAEAVLSEWANNRDLRSEAGEPCCRLEDSGEDREGTWVRFEADFSALGTAVDMPLPAAAFCDGDAVEWNFGSTPIATTARGSTPKEAADAMGMDVLLDASRRFVLAETSLSPEKSDKGAVREGCRILVEPDDACCRDCSGVLEVTGVAEATMGVECTECGDRYELEHDAFEAGFDYVLEFLSRRRPN